MSLEISMKALLESGVHFGHRTTRWDPRMHPFIFTERNGIHIIDLQQTVRPSTGPTNLSATMSRMAARCSSWAPNARHRKPSGWKPNRCGMPYVIERWLGGTLTNWTTIFARIMELETHGKNARHRRDQPPDQKRRP